MAKVKNGPRFLGNRDRLTKKIPKGSKTRLGRMPKDDVVEHFDFEKLACSNEVTSDFDVVPLRIILWS